MSESSNAIASKTYQVPPSKIGRGSHFLIDDRPCRVTEVRRFDEGFSTFNGIDMFKGDRHTYFAHESLTCEVPSVKAASYKLLYFSDWSFCLVLVLAALETISSLPTNEYLRHLMKLGLEMGEEVVVLVMSSMGEEHIQYVNFKSRAKAITDFVDSKKAARSYQ